MTQENFNTLLLIIIIILLIIIIILLLSGIRKKESNTFVSKNINDKFKLWYKYTIKEAKPQWLWNYINTPIHLQNKKQAVAWANNVLLEQKSNDAGEL